MSSKSVTGIETEARSAGVRAAAPGFAVAVRLSSLDNVDVHVNSMDDAVIYF